MYRAEMSKQKQRVIEAKRLANIWHLTLACRAKITRPVIPYYPYYGSGIYGVPVAVKIQYVWCECYKCKGLNNEN